MATIFGVDAGMEGRHMVFFRAGILCGDGKSKKLMMSLFRGWKEREQDVWGTIARYELDEYVSCCWISL